LQSSRATPNADQPTPGQHGRAASIAVNWGLPEVATWRTLWPWREGDARKSFVTLIVAYFCRSVSGFTRRFLIVCG
jgi:hypothetical protein